MSDEEKEKGSYIKGAVVAALIFAAMFFALEWLNKSFASEENANPLMLPKMHLLSLVINIILFRSFMRKDDKENTGKGILFVSFLFMVIYFAFIHK